MASSSSFVPAAGFDYTAKLSKGSWTGVYIRKAYTTARAEHKSVIKQLFAERTSYLKITASFIPTLNQTRILGWFPNGDENEFRQSFLTR